MYIQLLTCRFHHQHLAEVKKIFREEMIPQLSRQRGYVTVRLLEPQTAEQDYISMSEWRCRADAEACLHSAAFQQLMQRLTAFTTTAPTLAFYAVEENLHFEPW